MLLNTRIYVLSSSDREKIHNWAYENKLNHQSYYDPSYPADDLKVMFCCGWRVARHECCCVDKQGNQMCPDSWYVCNGCGTQYYTSEALPKMKMVKRSNMMIISKEPILMKKGLPKKFYPIDIDWKFNIEMIKPRIPHFTSPQWNKSKMKQIVGKGIRTISHTEFTFGFSGPLTIDQAEFASMVAGEGVILKPKTFEENLRGIFN